jgi:soluble lytic murein transglycosylase-like protein
MAPLKIVAATLMLTAGTPSVAETVADWHLYATEASRRFGVPVAWIERVMRVESDGRTTIEGHPIRSRAGAIGLMQLMPPTWRSIRSALGLGTDPDNPRDNILAGTFYLRLLYERFGYPGLFAAYNAGPTRYSTHLATGTALPAETIAYLRSVVGPAGAATRSASQARQSLFVAQHSAQSVSLERDAAPSLSTLFAVYHDAG